MLAVRIKRGGVRACRIQMTTQNSKGRRLRPATFVDNVHVGDSRTLVTMLSDQSINVTITSPPYFDMKDYGRKKQIGFGQDYDAYLNDLALVFKEVHRATVSNGSLWIIVDTFRKQKEVFALPFDIAARLKTVGWVLRDIVIWKKERTVPWAHAGAGRKIFEYILIFAKGLGDFKYDLDSYRDATDLKRWWVRYPERYNPRGKAPEEIWTYDIPTQGSWGDNYVRHFCPLPNELVARIVRQTTQPRDLVFDPFAGSGTVPAISKLLDRRYIGFELNSEYVEKFRSYLARELKKTSKSATSAEGSVATELNFEQTIGLLRILKYARLTLRALIKKFPKEQPSVFVFRQRGAPKRKFQRYRAEYVIAIQNKKSKEAVDKFVTAISQKPPLSKFGIEPTFKCIVSSASLKTRAKDYFRYTVTNSHSFSGRVNASEAWNQKGSLFSPIKLKVEEPDG